MRHVIVCPDGSLLHDPGNPGVVWQGSLDEAAELVKDLPRGEREYLIVPTIVYVNEEAA